MGNGLEGEYYQFGNGFVRFQRIAILVSLPPATIGE
jgi:hypothetical protein